MSNKVTLRIISFFAFAVLVATLALPAYPCSRVLWNNNGWHPLVGRNMDWFEDLQSNMWALPRGMERNGLTAENPLTWTSKYGSVVITAYDGTTVEGINEAGLAVHALYLPETGTSKRNPKVPGLAISMWAQWYLDNFATVSEAVKATKRHPYQLVMVSHPTNGKKGTIHLAIDDATGDSAILELINGEIKVYHGRQYTVMTNQPTYNKQLEILKQYQGFGGTKPLPGRHESVDRFVRAAYYVKHLKKPTSEREAIAALMSVMRNVSAPFGISSPERPNISTTIWRTVTDLKTGRIYFDGVYSPHIFWVDTKEINLAPGQPVRKLTIVGNYDLMGNVTGNFKKAKMFEFFKPGEDDFLIRKTN